MAYLDEEIKRDSVRSGKPGIQFGQEVFGRRQGRRIFDGPRRNARGES